MDHMQSPQETARGPPRCIDTLTRATHARSKPMPRLIHSRERPGHSQAPPPPDRDRRAPDAHDSVRRRIGDIEGSARCPRDLAATWRAARRYVLQVLRALSTAASPTTVGSIAGRAILARREAALWHAKRQVSSQNTRTRLLGKLLR